MFNNTEINASINDDDNDTIITDINTSQWKKEHENILIEWADKGMCYRWLHSKSHRNYSIANAWFTIPVIIMSTLTGTANFAQDRFSENAKPYVAISIGAVNIFAGILTTIQQFLKISELNEAHRVSSIAWDKFYRNIKVELAKSPFERIECLQMLKISKEEFDRLIETSPPISDDVIKEFKQTFSYQNKFIKDKDELERKIQSFNELKKPEICDILESARNSLYIADEKYLEKIKTVKTTKKQNDKVFKLIENTKNKLKIELNREPSAKEISTELDDKYNVEFIEDYIHNLTSDNAGNITFIGDDAV